MDTIRSWPTLGLKSCSKFQSCAARRKTLKLAGKKVPSSSIAHPKVFILGSIAIVPTNDGEDKAVSFEARAVIGVQQRVQLMTHAKVLLICIVDSDIE